MGGHQRGADEMMRSAFLWVSMTAMAATPQADLEISGPMHGATLTIRTSARTAGAIDSLTWRGKEFINSFDHGRELQSASSFDGYGECLNPTEAGSAKDGAGQTTSSRLLDSRADGHTLATTIEMAYWLAPGASYHQSLRLASGLPPRTQRDRPVQRHAHQTRDDRLRLYRL